jgi:hypothetical protein
LIQTERIKPFPIILVGSDFWSGLVGWLKDTMLDSGNISREDLDLFTILDDADQVIEFVRKNVVI